MTVVQDHPLFPTLLQEFEADAPSMRRTAQNICRTGFTVEDLLWTLGELAPWKLAVRAGRGSTTAAFRPDFGLLYEKLAPANAVLTTKYVLLDEFMRTNTGCWTVMTEAQLGNVTVARTFDFPDKVFSRLLNATVLNTEIRCAVWRMPAGGIVPLPLVAHLASTVGSTVEVAGESFRPFVVKAATISDIKVLVPAVI